MMSFGPGEDQQIIFNLVLCSPVALSTFQAASWGKILRR